MNLGHRTLAFLFFSLCLLLCTPRAHAETPKDILKTALDAVLDILKKPAYADPVQRKALRADIGKIVRNHFDFTEFSSRTTGQYWQKFTPAQKTAFSDTFADLLIQTYVNKIDGYNGEQIAFTGERSSAKGDRVEILTIITMKGGKKIPVSYRMLPKNGTWKVYDVLIENISLVKNYRTQFQDLLRTSTPEVVIERVRAKALEAAENKKKESK